MSKFSLSLLLLAAATIAHAQNLDWRVDLGPIRSTQLHVADDVVFVHGSQSLIRLDKDSGNTHSELALSSEMVPNNLISYEKKSMTHFLISSYENGDVVAYDTRLDNVMWSLHHIASKPVIDWQFGVGVYMLTEAGQILAIDSMSGFLVWAIEVDGGMAKDSTLHLSLDNDNLYVLSPDGQLQVYSAQDGSLLADSYFEGMEKTVLVGDFVYFYKDGTIAVYHINDSSTTLWKSNELGSLYNVLPMDDDKHVLIHTSTGLHKVKHWNGKLKWTFLEPTMDIVSLTTEAGAIFVVLELLEPSFLVKLDSKTGAKDWTYAIKGETIVGDVQVRDESLYMLTSDESLSSHLIKIDVSDSYHLQVGDSAVYQ